VKKPFYLLFLQLVAFFEFSMCKIVTKIKIYHQYPKTMNLINAGVGLESPMKAETCLREPMPRRNSPRQHKFQSGRIDGDRAPPLVLRERWDVPRLETQPESERGSSPQHSPDVNPPIQRRELLLKQHNHTSLNLPGHRLGLILMTVLVTFQCPWGIILSELEMRPHNGLWSRRLRNPQPCLARNPG
jgi:hypothetical protein